MNEKIISFLKQNTCLTLSTCYNNIPYCASCFYAFDENEKMLVFKSDATTNHIKQAILNKKIAGSVSPDKLEPTRIKGIQFQGNFVVPENDLLNSLKKIYYGKYPFAIGFSGDIWALELTQIKMTDNTLGFGKKIEWEKEVK